MIYAYILVRPKVGKVRAIGKEFNTFSQACRNIDDLMMKDPESNAGLVEDRIDIIFSTKDIKDEADELNLRADISRENKASQESNQGTDDNPDTGL